MSLGHSFPGHLLFGLLQYTLHGVPLKSIRTFQLVQDAAIWMGAQRTVRVTCLLHKLHCMPVCFLVQFKMLVMTFKAWHVNYGTFFIEFYQSLPPGQAGKVCYGPHLLKNSNWQGPSPGVPNLRAAAWHRAAGSWPAGHGHSWPVRTRMGMHFPPLMLAPMAPLAHACGCEWGR